ncbi:MAG: site-specific DNA-methyltransferase [Methylovulum sp.]|uniref:site-specific DNA-methyltransferase n=1 Tax=Methylovulum sp. TaxID=1916980 RepID=UPI002616CD37|nr:site-specific DNA-methyltransferase [Methylovulum sp.]MDD2725508.1 site-specific DNA-methyltransferase [Methylovulum sp.]MDD5126104.1 site-specific DNA-methyltransferase [Methylovulum sp.]
MDKLKLHSPDLTEANITKLAELFPNCVTEIRDGEGGLQRVIDFDLLKQELSASVVEGAQERYQLNWPGKREALLTANAPIAKTLRPCRDESVDFDSTQNLYIEGDNLDALKLLQETYLGKVKMIYIDPPYNTGNDFIYEDDFAEDTASYLQRSNQKDEVGNRLVANNDSNGRFHSDWLSMMYSRLRLAWNLLSDKGILVASIDENELVNLRKLSDEIFGKDNLLFQITLLCNPKGRSQDKFVANCHEYLVGYSRQQLNKGDTNIPKDNYEIEKNYKLFDKRGRYRELELRNTHREFGKHNRKNLYFPFFVSNLGEVLLEEALGFIPVFPNWDDGFEGCWTWGKDKALQQLDEIVAKEVKGNWKIYRKNYAEDEDGEATKQVKSIWTEKQFHTEKGQSAFNELFETKDKIFQSPKSVDTIRELLLMGSYKDSFVIDFFSGSATTAHAVMQLNAEDGGKRKFIMVQLPETCDQKSEAFKAGYPTIAEIGKERIRRAGQKIKQDNADKPGIENLDIGFRVLKIDSSNMKDVYYTPDQLNQNDLEQFTDNIKADRSAEDLLFQVLLAWGVDLTLPISQETIVVKDEGGRLKDEVEAENSSFIPQPSSFKNYPVFFVDGNALAACFETDINDDCMDAGVRVMQGAITEAFVKELSLRKPLRVVFRDDGFASDSVKINIGQIFKLLSPTTEIKTI